MIRLREQIQRRGRSLLIAGALGLVCLALAWAHGAPETHEMSAMGDDSMAEAATICLAVLQVGSGLLTLVLGALLLQRWRDRRRVLGAAFERGVGIRIVPTPTFSARAGPAALQVLRC